MFVARILYPVEVLGPGKRIGLWLSGCSRKCAGCSNPELWKQNKEQYISVEHLSTLIHRLAQDHPVHGITITGGEPMDQAKEVSLLMPLLHDVTEDVLMYSGYTLEELQKRKDPCTETVLRLLAVLIDGDYQEKLNDGSSLRGSSNQQIHIFRETVQDIYTDYLRSSNQIQNFSMGQSIVSAGIHHPDYQVALKNAVKQKGLIEND